MHKIRTVACSVCLLSMLAGMTNCGDPGSRAQAVQQRSPDRPNDSTPVQNKPADAKPADTEPADTKPADTKPADTKPVDTAPAQTQPAEEKKPFATPQPTLPTMDVKLDGKVFKLEKALTLESRFRGLSGRTSIASDGGMIFVFPIATTTHFVMRDCPIPIDIIFADATGRITAMHAMQPEPERSESERELTSVRGVPQWGWVNEDYEERLKKYTSRYSALIAIELKGGTLNLDGSNPKGVTLKVGDKLDLDVAALRKQAQ